MVSVEPGVHTVPGYSLTCPQCGGKNCAGQGAQAELANHCLDCNWCFDPEEAVENQDSGVVMSSTEASWNKILGG